MVEVLVYHGTTTFRDPNGFPSSATYGRVLGTDFSFLLAEQSHSDSSYAGEYEYIGYNQLPGQIIATNARYVFEGLGSDRLAFSSGDGFTFQTQDNTGEDFFAPVSFERWGDYQTFIAQTDRVDFRLAGGDGLFATNGVDAPQLILTEPIEDTYAVGGRLWAIEEFAGATDEEFGDGDVFLISEDLGVARVYDYDNVSNTLRFHDVFDIGGVTLLYGQDNNDDEFYRYNPSTGALNDLNIVTGEMEFEGYANGFFLFWDNQFINGDWTGTELFVSDGTAAGTGLLLDIGPGDLGSYPGTRVFGKGVAVGDRYFFFANDTQPDGNELWVTDGTPGGTQKVTGTGTSFGAIDVYAFGSPMVALNDTQVLFPATGPNGVELHVSDGTAAGTHLFADIAPAEDDSFPTVYEVHDGLAYFTVTGGPRSGDLWVTDGTTAGTMALTDVRVENGPSRPAMATVVDLHPDSLPLRHVDGSGSGETLRGNFLRDEISGRGGNDLLIGARAEDVLNGGGGHDVLRAGAGADQLNGGGGRDKMIGGGGDDILVGGRGNDTHRGGGGGDTFVFAGRFGHDRILDLRDGDVIDLSAIGRIEGVSDLLGNHLDTSGANPVIEAGGRKTITLVGVDPGTLDAGDFLFATG